MGDRPRMRSVTAVVLGLLLLAGCSASPSPRRPAPTTPGAPAAPAAGNDRAGTPNWQVTRPGAADAIEGFADRTSVLPGAPIRLFVSTTAPSFTVTAYRIGAYTGSDAHAVWTSPPQPGRRQAPAVVQRPRNTAVAPWDPSLTVATDGWQPGTYLLRLDASSGEQRFVPLTVRTPVNTGRVVIVDAVTTWQAYNAWGGYSLYDGPDGRREDRARAVSFDRPYDVHFVGAGQYLQFELAAVRVAEHAGVPLGYATDVDLHADPHLLDGAAAVLFLGHDEYWSSAMRAAVLGARDGHGVNVAFLGGNEAYRHIRLEDSPNGPGRVEVNYKSAGEDPAARTDPAEATQDWRLPPDPRPESVLTGEYYACFPGTAPLVTGPESWLTSGLLKAGEALPGVVGVEYARADPAATPTPRPMQVLFRSPVLCGTTRRPDHADAVWFTLPSGAGVFSSGTQGWVDGLDPAGTGAAQGGRVARVLDAVTTRLLQVLAAGPAGRVHPAVDNLAVIATP
jgi:hypothetical protein